MIDAKLHTAAGAIVFFWCGCVMAISFLEAWLKFRAPGVTIPIGLGIGRLVFTALNRLEWVLAICTTACMLYATKFWHNGGGCLLSAAIVLILETAWLLPTLDKRAQAWLDGQPPAPSQAHLIFVAAETFKLIFLVLAGIKLLKLF